MSIYDQIGINYNKGTRRVNSVAPGCTIEYEADEPEREVRPVYVRRPNPWVVSANKPEEAQQIPCPIFSVLKETGWLNCSMIILVILKYWQPIMVCYD